MPKAKYRELLTKDIVLDEDRQRKEYDDIEDLADSIREKGLLQPIGVEDTTHKLVWGGRRYKAISLLGLEKVSCRIVPPDLSPLELEELELEENIQRKDLTWQERSRAIKRIDDLKKSIHGDQAETGDRSSWSTRKTANLLGKSSGGISDQVNLAQALEMFPELEACRTADEARKSFKKLIEQAAVKQLVKQAKKSKTSSAFRFAESHYMIGDAIKGLKELGQTSASFAIVDPPYAIRLDKIKKVDFDIKSKKQLADYSELTDNQYIPFITEVATQLYRILGENAWVVWWYGQEWYGETLEVLQKAGFSTDKIPATWGKIDASGQTNQPDLYLGRATETFFVAKKGNPALAKRGRANLFLFKPVPSQRKTHPTEKPLDLAQELFDVFCYPGSICVVPFLGSGVDLRAAYSRNCSGFGWDLSEDYKDKFLYEVQKDIENGTYS